MSLFADDTNLFTADLASVRRGLEIVEEFGKIAGLRKQKRSGLGNGQTVGATLLE